MRRQATELALGMRMALLPGARLRAGLTAAGVALGVALLLLAASVPNVIHAHDARNAAREPIYAEVGTRLLMTPTDTSFRGRAITGFTMQVIGPHPPVPPGVQRLPGSGEIVVSPALRALLSGDRTDRGR